MCRKKSMVLWFIILSALSVTATVGVLFFTHGEAFPRIFFHDSKDTGMDFFHSIEYVRGREPYALFNTLYPPLANFFFYLLIRFVPQWQYESWAPTFSESVQARASAIDLRVWQPTMLMFVIYIITISILTVFLVQSCLKKEIKGNETFVNLFCVGVLCSFGVLYSFERGNIILLAFLSCLFFERYRTSKRWWMKALAIVMLAIGAGLKIYPALFGMMLIYDRQKRDIVPAIVLGILMLLLPSFAFREGLGAIKIFLLKVGSYSAVSEFSTVGFSFDRICNTVIDLFSSLTERSLDVNGLLAALPKWNLFVAAFILVCGFFLDKRWEKLLVCCVAMMLYSYQPYYVSIFFLIPFICMVCEERTINKKNAFMYFSFILSLLMLPIMDIGGCRISLVNIRFQLCMVNYVGYIVIRALSRMIKSCTRFVIRNYKRA